MNIFFSSDFHYNHKNIVRGTSQWGDAKGQRTRDFNTLEEHNMTLVKNINATVGGQDILYFLGDWSFGGFDSIRQFREQLNVGTIHFIFGNHDHHIVNNKQEIRQLFASCNQYVNKQIGGQSMFLCHYAMRTWDKAHHGKWNLYGHSHGSLPEYEHVEKFKWQLIDEIGQFPAAKLFYKAMDVGVDTHPEFRPYHMDEIAAIMSRPNRINLLEDHHTHLTS